MKCPEHTNLRWQKVDVWLPQQGVGTGSSANGHEASFWNDENVLKLDCGDDWTTVNLLKNYRMLHLKQVDFMVYNLHLHKIVLKNEKYYANCKKPTKRPCYMIPFIGSIPEGKSIGRE